MGNTVSGEATGGDSAAFLNGGETCRAAGLTYYRLLKLAARGEVRTRINPFGHTLFSVDDARRFAGCRAHA